MSRTLTHIASSILLLLLQQKCQEWLQKGVTPLPSFCVDVGGRAEITAVQLDGYYQQYAAAVSPEERQSDLSAAIYSSDSQTGGMLA
ncbi:hypothetical protein C0Q70_00404 [Pomacea canaliculata]|uniref:Uncharacterized protein n=1 Tax=Pomacea canaliculata TaxID=400727 RepID=A0A2T7PWK1_POMCA|nr:hypothetical protein C0Q70_00404 [Pomacea canaliculata]